MSAFGQSTTGRVLAFAAGLMLAGGGFAALSTGIVSLMAMSLPLLVGIAVTIVAVPLGVDRFPYQIILALIGLPVGLFLYAIALNVIIHYAPAYGYVLIALSIPMFLSAALAPKPAGSLHALESAH